MNKDIQVLRELCKQTMEIAARDVMDERRALWRDFNSLKTRRVPVYILDPQGMWREVFSEKELACEDGFFRQYENWLRLKLYHATFGDDVIIEPWITVKPAYGNENPDWQTWGVHIALERIQETMAYHLIDPPVAGPDDLGKLIAPAGIIDEEKTRRNIDVLEDAVGDIIAVVPDYYPPGICNLSYTLACLLGPEQMFYQMLDQPDMVHALSKIISENSLTVCDSADKQGLFSNCDQSFLSNPGIQAPPYCHELPNPGLPRRAVSIGEHWIYDCSQEFESVGPAMYEEFVLSYQRPIYEKFGLTAYGCCEGLTKKIPYLKKTKNLRRVAVTPWADDEECAEQLGDKYIVSWRPNPAEMVMSGFDAEKVKAIVRRARRIYEGHGCHWEINLKDFISVERDRDRLKNWVAAVREALE